MKTALDTGEIKQDIPGCGTIKIIKILLLNTKLQKLKDSQIREMNYQKSFYLDLLWLNSLLLKLMNLGPLQKVLQKKITTKKVI